jgi:hypothetical protein
LWQICNLPEASFVDKLYEARAVLREYQGKQGLGRIDNKMAYWFRILESLIGMSAPQNPEPYPLRS